MRVKPTPALPDLAESGLKSLGFRVIPPKKKPLRNDSGAILENCKYLGSLAFYTGA